MSAHTQFYLNDTWTPDVDGLGYTHLRDALVDTAVQAQPPFSVAVYGGWGSGKTSLLRAVMCRLGGDLTQIAPEEALLPDTYEVNAATLVSWGKLRPKNTSPLPVCVWFNPWQHQHETHPMVALLHEIRQCFSFKLKALTKAGKLAQVALKTGLRLLDDLTGSVTKTLTGHAVQFGLDKIEATGTAYEQARFQQKLDSQRFQLHFETAVAHLVGGKKPNPKGRLVIFIDDLDRCESGPMFKLLESIKLYLATRQCVFVFGLDPHHTESGLRGAGLKDEHHARAYLHKLFQMAVHLPRPQALVPFIEGHIKALALDALFSDTQELALLLVDILEANPRRIKNFLNQLALRGRALHKSGRTALKGQWLALLIALRYYFPAVYSALEEQPDCLEQIKLGMKTRHPRDGSSGLISTVARLTHLPQMEIADPEKETNFSAVTLQEHYADTRGLFWVLDRFKQKFDEAFAIEGSEDLKEYLAP